MSESHSKGEQRHRPLALAVTDSRSAMTRASDGCPFRPYVYRGGEKEPAAVIAVRQRHRALDDERQRQRERGGALAPVRAPEATPDPAPSYEWHREPDGGPGAGRAGRRARPLPGRDGRRACAAQAGPAARARPRRGGQPLQAVRVPDHLGRAPGDVR